MSTVAVESVNFPSLTFLGEFSESLVGPCHLMVPDTVTVPDLLWLKTVLIFVTGDVAVGQNGKAVDSNGASLIMVSFLRDKLDTYGKKRTKRLPNSYLQSKENVSGLFKMEFMKCSIFDNIFK